MSDYEDSERSSLLGSSSSTGKRKKKYSHFEVIKRDSDSLSFEIGTCILIQFSRLIFDWLTSTLNKKIEVKYNFNICLFLYKINPTDSLTFIYGILIICLAQ